MEKLNEVEQLEHIAIMSALLYSETQSSKTIDVIDAERSRQEALLGTGDGGVVNRMEKLNSARKDLLNLETALSDASLLTAGQIDMSRLGDLDEGEREDVLDDIATAGETAVFSLTDSYVAKLHFDRNDKEVITSMARLESTLISAGYETRGNRKVLRTLSEDTIALPRVLREGDGVKTMADAIQATRLIESRPGLDDLASNALAFMELGRTAGLSDGLARELPDAAVAYNAMGKSLKRAGYSVPEDFDKNNFNYAGQQHLGTNSEMLDVFKSVTAFTGMITGNDADVIDLPITQDGFQADLARSALGAAAKVLVTDASTLTKTIASTDLTSEEQILKGMLPLVDLTEASHKTFKNLQIGAGLGDYLTFSEEDASQIRKSLNSIQSAGSVELINDALREQEILEQARIDRPENQPRIKTSTAARLMGANLDKSVLEDYLALNEVMTDIIGNSHIEDMDEVVLSAKSDDLEGDDVHLGDDDKVGFRYSSQKKYEDLKKSDDAQAAISPVVRHNIGSEDVSYKISSSEMDKGMLVVDRLIEDGGHQRVIEFMGADREILESAAIAAGLGAFGRETNVTEMTEEDYDKRRRDASNSVFLHYNRGGRLIDNGVDEPEIQKGLYVSKDMSIAEWNRISPNLREDRRVLVLGQTDGKEGIFSDFSHSGVELLHQPGFDADRQYGRAVRSYLDAKINAEEALLAENPTAAKGMKKTTGDILRSHDNYIIVAPTAYHAKAFREFGDRLNDKDRREQEIDNKKALADAHIMEVDFNVDDLHNFQRRASAAYIEGGRNAAHLEIRKGQIMVTYPQASMPAYGSSAAPTPVRGDIRDSRGEVREGENLHSNISMVTLDDLKRQVQIAKAAGSEKIVFSLVNYRLADMRNGAPDKTKETAAVSADKGLSL